MFNNEGVPISIFRVETQITDAYPVCRGLRHTPNCMNDCYDTCEYIFTVAVLFILYYLFYFILFCFILFYFILLQYLMEHPGLSTWLHCPDKHCCCVHLYAGNI